MRKSYIWEIQEFFKDAEPTEADKAWNAYVEGAKNEIEYSEDWPNHVSVADFRLWLEHGGYTPEADYLGADDIDPNAN